MHLENLFKVTCICLLLLLFVLLFCSVAFCLPPTKHQEDAERHDYYSLLNFKIQFCFLIGCNTKLARVNPVFFFTCRPTCSVTTKCVVWVVFVLTL